MKRLPDPAYTVAEAERLLELPEKRAYALAKEKRLRAVRDITGQMRVPYAEVYAILRAREKGVSDV